MGSEIEEKTETSRGQSPEGSIETLPVPSPPAPPAPPAPPPALEVPNGGLLAWLQVLGSFFLFFNSWGIINTFGVYQAYYSTILPETQSNIAWIGSIQAYLLLLVGVITGPMFDSGYFRSLLFVGTFLIVFGMMMTSICTHYWQLMLAQAVCVGIGCGCIFVPSIAILPTYFSTRKAFATGIAASGSSFGGVILPITFNNLLRRIGFAWATRVIGFISLATLLVSLTVMRVRVQPAQTRRLWEPAALKEAPFGLFTLGIFLGFCGLYTPFFYTQSYAINTGIMDENLAQYLFSILNAASTFGRIIPSYIADWIGPFNVLIPCTYAAALLAFSWVAIKNSPGLLVFTALYGFFSGTFVSLPPTAIFSISPNPRMLGTRLGMNFALGGLGVLIGTPVAGQLINSHGFSAAIVWCGATVTAGATTFLLSRTSKHGLKLWTVA